MKLRSVISLLLVFSMCFAFCACRKLDKNGDYTIESQAYFVDDEGYSRVVQSGVNQEGVTEYFYIDSMGEVVTVAQNKVQVETKKVTTSTTAANASGTETTAPAFDVADDIDLTPAQQEFIEKWQDPNAVENIIEEAPPISLELAEEIIDEEKFVNNVVVETDSKGAPIHEGGSGYGDFYADLKNSDTFTLKITSKIINSDGSEFTTPFTLVRSGKNMYLATKMPMDETTGGTIALNMIVKDGKCYLCIPKMLAYMEVPADYMDEFSSEMDMATTQEDGSVYVESFDYKSGGKTYKVDKYTADGVDILYYYLNGQLKRVETKSSDGSCSIIEYTEFTKTADKSKFNIPSYYMNMTDLMGAENFEGLF